MSKLLLVFDLDGTLLNRSSVISGYTRDTLLMLGQRNIAYTVATGRTLHAARDVIAGHGFRLPHVYKNGVVIWDPYAQRYSQSYLLAHQELATILKAFQQEAVTPFLFTLEDEDKHAVYHAPLLNDVERALVKTITTERGLPVRPISELPSTALLTNVSAIGEREHIEQVVALIQPEPSLVAYTGDAIEDKNLCWVDIHHSDGSKGSAIATLKEQLKVSRVICFGDGDNDLSMFAGADEAYAPANADDAVKAAATAVIGHHEDDGIARFLRERFSLSLT